MKIRLLLIPLVLRFHRKPFVWIFRLYYWMAVQCCRVLLARVEEIESVYLTGSLAREDVIYGLSDIDFKILVAGPKRPEVAARIHRCFQSLRRIFPILGPPDEKGIYFLESFAADYRQHPLVQHLFDPRFFQHRLLSGKDLLPSLPLKGWMDLDQSECAHSRLKDWIERIHILADYSGFATQQKQHLYFKAVSDIGLLALRIENPERQFANRREILEKILSSLEEPCGTLAHNLALENENYYRRALNSNEENFLLFKEIITFCAKRIAAADTSAPAGLQVRNLPTQPSEADAAVLTALPELSASIKTVRVFAWPHLPLNPFDLERLTARTYLVECSRQLGFSEFLRLKNYGKQNLRNGEVLLIQENPFFISSVDSELLDHWGSFQGSSDLLYLLVSEAPPSITQIEELRIRERLRAFREQLSSALRDPRLGRMDPAVFSRFLFNALRVLILSHELANGRWHWITAPSGIKDYLLQVTPLEQSFVHALDEEFHRSIGQHRIFNERLMPKARTLLSVMLEMVQQGQSWEALRGLNDMPDERYLSISAAVVTAGRPAQLKRCLESIAALLRRPDELIVVNDGTDPASREVIEGLQVPFPVRYIETATQGVALARNVAGRASKSEILAFVDDDAYVAPDWMDRIERVFLRDPQIGIAAGSILNMQCGRTDRIWQFMEVAEKL